MVRELPKSLQTKERTQFSYVSSARENHFCLSFVILLSIYAVVCSNVVVHNSEIQAVRTGDWAVNLS
jgi:hypothetical protein